MIVLSNVHATAAVAKTNTVRASFHQIIFVAPATCGVPAGAEHHLSGKQRQDSFKPDIIVLIQ